MLGAMAGFRGLLPGIFETSGMLPDGSWGWKGRLRKNLQKACNDQSLRSKPLFPSRNPNGRDAVVLQSRCSPPRTAERRIRFCRLEPILGRLPSATCYFLRRISAASMSEPVSAALPEQRRRNAGCCRCFQLKSQDKTVRKTVRKSG